MRSGLFPRILLILALLFAQLGALTHGIPHVLAEQKTGSDQSLPPHTHCDLCAAYAQIGSAIGSNSASFVAGGNGETPHLNDSITFISTAFAAFAARAPPYSA